MNEKEIFESAIKQNRYDQSTRLVFADWLEEHGYDDEAVVQRLWTKEKQQSEDWLREFAGTLGETCTNYDDVWQHKTKAVWEIIAYDMLIKVANEFLDTGEGFIQMGSEMARDILYNDTVREEFWKHFAVVTGRSASEEQKEELFIGCYC